MMTSEPRRRIFFRWTAPKNLLAIILFITAAIIVEYVFVQATAGTVEDSAAIMLPFLNVSISPSYHILPLVVITTLTASFTHLAGLTAMLPPKTQPMKRPSQQRVSRKRFRLRSMRELTKRIGRAGRKFKDRILRITAFAYIRRRVSVARAMIRSAIIVTATFIILILLITVASYPGLVPTATFDFYQWNTAFLRFVAATIEASKAIAEAIPPIGILGSSIQSALSTAAPGFHNTLEAAASSITSGLVSLSPTGKYLVVQNVAAWAVAIITLLYSQYAKVRRYKR